MNLNKIIFITVLILIALLIGASIYNSRKPVTDYRTITSISEEVATTTGTTSTYTLPQLPDVVETNARVMGPADVVVPMYQIGIASGVAIRLNDFVQESRCPVDVQCIQAGAVVVNTTIKVGDNEVTRNFPSDEVPFEFEGFAISIKDIKPDLKVGQKIEPKDYVITFTIAPTAKGDTI